MSILISFQNCTPAFESTQDSASENDSSQTDCTERLGNYCKPHDGNTGLKNTTISLTLYTSDFETQADGQVIENADFTGCVSIRHQNVIIRNSVFRGYISSTADSCRGLDGSSVRIEDSEFIGSSGNGGGVSLYRNHIHGLRNSDFWRNPQDATWESNYFEDWIATSAEPHMDTIQWWWNRPNPPADVNLTVRGNRWNIDNTYPFANQYNAILFMGGNGPMQENITWEYNWMRAGGFLLRLGSTSGTLRINYNIFEGWGWGPLLYGADYQTMINNPNFEFLGNQVVSGGNTEPFDKPCKPGGINMNLFGFNPFFSCPN